MLHVPRLIPKVTGAVIAAGLIAVPALAGDFVFVSDEAKSGLEAQSSRFNTMLVSPDTDLRAYSGVAIRSVIVKPRDKDFAKRLSSSDRRELVRGFRRHFGNGLGDRLVENGAGEGALVLSAAITYAWPNRDITGRYIRTRGAGPGSASTTTGVGSASFEAVLKDARSGEVVAVIADKYTGTSFASNSNLNTRWGDARDGFRRWGRNLSKELGTPAGS